jgi:hypothetical protein
VEEKPSTSGEDETVQDAQDGVERIRVGILANRAFLSARVPESAKVPALNEPCGAVAADANVIVGCRAGTDDIELKLDFGAGSADKTLITAKEDVEEAGVGGGQGNRHAADFDAGSVSGGRH